MQKLINFEINNRTKDRFQFAPVLEVKSIQRIEIVNFETIYNCATGKPKYLIKIKKVFVDGWSLPPEKIKLLSMNDGFQSVFDLFKFFNTTNFTGKLIHWTSLRY